MTDVLLIDDTRAVIADKREQIRPAIQQNRLLTAAGWVLVALVLVVLL
jgi:hypothetical protein